MTLGIYRISDIYHANTRAQLQDGRWAMAVAVPCPTNFWERLRASWFVLFGRAVAIYWPQAGDIETTLALGRGVIGEVRVAPDAKLPAQSLLRPWP